MKSGAEGTANLIRFFLIRACLIIVVTHAQYAFAFTEAVPGSDGDLCDLHFASGHYLLHLPAAVTPAKQRLGLSGTPIAEAPKQMLFWWDNSAHRAFWMRDTHLPLDIAFFADSGELMQLETMTANSLRIHRSELPARFVVELPAGDFAKQGIKPGDRVVRLICNQSL